MDVWSACVGLARTERAHPRVTYPRQPMEETDFPPERFDLVVGSLAFHYVRDYRGPGGAHGRWLAPGASSSSPPSTPSTPRGPRIAGARRERDAEDR